MSEQSKHDPNENSLFTPVITRTNLMVVPKPVTEEKKSLFSRMLPFLLGFLFFVIFTFFFLPLSSIVESQILSQVSPPNQIELSGLQVSYNGKVQIKSLSLYTPKYELQLEESEAKFSPFALLFSKTLDGHAQAILSKLQFSTYSLKKSLVQIRSKIHNVHKNTVLWEGQTQVQISSGNIKAESVPFLGQDIEAKLNQIKLDFKMKKNSLLFLPGKNFLDADLARIQLKGQINFISRSLNLDLVITPKETFYQKFAEFGIKEMLSSMHYLDPNGNITISITGTFQSPRINPKLQNAVSP
ncbi:MAG: hypothetical protein D6767_05760 [Candidatus Hydrogenedentota bacterium]|nr:MAG: hypothetical protein D6767_05760 [Candidatus Hydrogenedentota bacterium]